MNKPAPSYASRYKPSGSYVSQGQRRPSVTTPITATKGPSIPPTRQNPDPNLNTVASTQGKVTRPQKSILQAVPIRADTRGRERSYLSGTLTTRNKLRPKSPHHKAKSPESRPKPPKQALLPWDKEVPLGSTVPGPLLVSLPITSGPQLSAVEIEQVQHEMNEVPVIEDQEEFIEKGIIEEEVYLLSEELLDLVPNETSFPQASPEIEQLEIPVPPVRECLTQDLTIAPEFDEVQPLHSVKPDLSTLIDDQVDGVLYFSTKYSPEPLVEIDTSVVSDEEVMEKTQLESKADFPSHPVDTAQAHNTNNNDVQQCYPVDTTHILVMENSEYEQSDYEVEPVDAGIQSEEKDTIQDPKMETREEPVLSEEDSNCNSAPSNKCHVEPKAPTLKPEVKSPRELKFAEEKIGNGAKRNSYRSKSVDRNNTSRYSQMAQNRNGRGLKLSEQYPSNGPPAVHPSTYMESPKKNTQRDESKPKPREASKSRLKSDLKPKQRVEARKNNAVIYNSNVDPEGTTGDVKSVHTVLFHDLGKLVVGTLRFRNVSDESILFRVTAVKDDIPFSIEPKEGQLGSGKSVVIKLQCNSVSKFARIAEQTFKIETIRLSVKNALNLSSRNWMHCKSTKAVFTTSNLMLNNTSSILRHYASNLDNERFQPTKPPERKHSVNVHSLLLDIQKGQAENLRIHWYQKMHFLFAAVLACAGCFWLSPIEPASFSRMISN